MKYEAKMLPNNYTLVCVRRNALVLPIIYSLHCVISRCVYNTKSWCGVIEKNKTKVDLIALKEFTFSKIKGCVFFQDLSLSLFRPNACDTNCNLLHWTHWAYFWLEPLSLIYWIRRILLIIWLLSGQPTHSTNSMYLIIFCFASFSPRVSPQVYSRSRGNFVPTRLVVCGWIASSFLLLSYECTTHI